MTVADRATLQTEADVVAAEVIAGRNTAARVGGLLRDLADSVALSSDPVAPSGLVVTGTPAVGNYVRWSGSQAYWGSNAAYNITSFSSAVALVQIGGTVATPAFTAAHTLVPTSLALTDSEGTPSKNVVGTPNAFTSNGSFMKGTPNATVTFTLTGSDGISPSVATRTMTWVNRVYYGTKVPAAFNAAFITGLPANALQPTGNKVFSAASAPTEHKYFAFPTRLGTASVVIGGFSYGWTVISTAIAVTNSDGYTENYTLIENENLGVAAETITVTVA